MDRNLNFRALLVSIQDRLSNDDRKRLHFIIGDCVPRTERENITLGGTLIILETLYDRGLISEDDVDFLIEIFRKMRCYDAAKRLEEYKLSQEPPGALPRESPKERQLTMTDVFDDNTETDKHQSSAYDRLLSVDSDFPAFDKPFVRKTTVTELSSIPPKIPVISDTSPTNIPSQKTQRKFFKSPMTLCLYGLFFVQIIALSICLWFFLHKKPIHRDVYILKNGSILQNITGKWFDHSKNLSLTFADQLIHVKVSHDANDDHMYSIKFIYSRNNTIEHQFQKSIRPSEISSTSLNFKKQKLKGITQCYAYNNTFTRLVRLRFIFNDQPPRSFGSCLVKSQLDDNFPNHVIGYALGKIYQYLTGFQFVWYNICPLNSQVKLCEESNPDPILEKEIYKD